MELLRLRLRLREADEGQGGCSLSNGSSILHKPRYTQITSSSSIYMYKTCTHLLYHTIDKYANDKGQLIHEYVPNMSPLGGAL